MLRREGNDFRKVFVSKLLGRDDSGKIDWDRTWKLAKNGVPDFVEAWKLREHRPAVK